MAPIQLAIRLLIPEGSLLLELPEVRGDGPAVRLRGPVLPLAERDARLDALCAAIQETIKREERRRTPRLEIFRKIWDLAQAASCPSTCRWRRARRCRT